MELIIKYNKRCDDVACYLLDVKPIKTVCERVLNDIQQIDNIQTIHLTCHAAGTGILEFVIYLYLSRHLPDKRIKLFLTDINYTEENNPSFYIKDCTYATSLGNLTKIYHSNSYVYLMSIHYQMTYSLGSNPTEDNCEKLLQDAQSLSKFLTIYEIRSSNKNKTLVNYPILGIFFQTPPATEVSFVNIGITTRKVLGSATNLNKINLSTYLNQEQKDKYTESYKLAYSTMSVLDQLPDNLFMGGVNPDLKKEYEERYKTFVTWRTPTDLSAPKSERSRSRFSSPKVSTKAPSVTDLPAPESEYNSERRQSRFSSPKVSTKVPSVTDLPAPENKSFIHRKSIQSLFEVDVDSHKPREYAFVHAFMEKHIP